MSDLGVYKTNQYNGSSLLSSGKSGASSLDVSDFLNLFVTELTHQDISSPMDNTQFIAQMAQFTLLQAVKELKNLSTTQYGASLLGKTAVVAEYDKSGKYKEETGVIQSVDFSGDEAKLTINGNSYGIGSVMKIVQGTV
ncbi:MAG: flagellar hook capping FlgD N-terminal domain-containing protein [Bacillota bacterium]|nr:flagellar hook capping FlgD N-terminal domain-containing protein [Bacillota bacterium]